MNDCINLIESLHCNIALAVEEISKTDPYHLAYIGDGQYIDYQNLNRLVKDTCVFLSKTVSIKSHPIGLAFINDLNTLVFSIALVKLGISQLQLSPHAISNHTIRCMHTLKVKHLITDIDVNIKHLTVTLIKNLQKDTLNLHKDKKQETRKHYNIDASLSFIGSGTTGNPKIITHNTSALCEMIKRDLKARPIKLYQRHLSLSGLYFFTALRRSFAAIVTKGTIVSLRDNLEPHNILRITNVLAVDHLSLAGVHAYNIIEKYKTKKTLMPRLSSIIVGGSPVSQTLRENITEVLNPNLFIGYGTNEFGEAIVLDVSKNPRYILGSVGRPISGVDVKIISVHTKNPIEEVGLIYLSSPTIKKMHSDSKFSKQNWQNTGDLGKVHSNGEIIFLGRSDDLIIFNGINIYPREIESILENKAGIKEVAAFSIDSEKNGNLPVACVVASFEGLHESSLLNYCKQFLGVKAPKRIFFIKKMPRNTAGKILKRELKKRFSSIMSQK